MTDLPTGTITFLFTDIQGSTNLVRTLGDRWPDVLEEHHAILRAAIRGHNGVDVRTEGDAFFAVFRSAVDAIAATADAQRGLAEHPWPDDGPIRVRMGMHTGEGRLGGDEYVGLDVHRAARIAAAGHGGQVLISEATKALVADKLPAAVTLRDLGEHRLKDFDEPQGIHQLVIEGVPTDFPSLTTLEVPTNLPVQLTSFVGRKRELAELDGLLSRNRLVTLIGPGGTGKTRMALEAANRRTDPFRDGVFFVDLSPIRQNELVASSIVQALSLKERPGRSALETVEGHLADRSALLLLDNFEQVVEAAPVVESILRAAPGVKIMATSRIRLGLLGEQEFPVPPLGVPGEGTVEDPSAIADNEAVRLFVDRARAVQPSFQLTGENAPAIAEITARLDGLPLAIELAAAQLRILSPSELAARLDQRLPLRTGAANVPERQRTLRGAIEWSYELLEESSRRLFARLSTFAGGASFAAIEAACNPNADLGMDTFTALEALVDHSLIRRAEHLEGSRFEMLETIREYADERLRADYDREDTRMRHAEFFATLAKTWGPSVRSAEAQEATRALKRDYENLRSALSWTIEADRADIGLRIGAPLWMFWVEHGPLAEGRRVVGSLLELSSAAARDRLRAAALDAFGALTYWEGAYEASEKAYRDAVAIYRELGDLSGAVGALTSLGYLSSAKGDPAKAEADVAEALEIARAGGLKAAAAEASGVMALVRSYQGDLDGALSVTLQALEDLEVEGSPYWVNQMHSRLGAIYLRMGRLDEAETELRVALAELRSSSGAIGVGSTISILSGEAAARGEHDRALRLSGISEAISERMGSSPPLGLVWQFAEYVEASRAAVGEQAAARLLAEGKAMDEAEVIAYALRESP